MKFEEIKTFRYILRIDNQLAHLLHQVTYVTTSGIKKVPTNLQIYKSFHLSWVGVGLFNCLFQNEYLR